MIRLPVLLAALVLCGHAHATTMLLPRSDGGDDTAAMQNACNAGPVVLTSRGNNGAFHVSTVNCKDMGANPPGAPAEFWYEGQEATIQLRGTSSSVRGVLNCPYPGPCSYSGFTVYPPAVAAGIVADSIHGVQLLNMSVVDDGGGNSGDCVDLTSRGGGMVQSVMMYGGSYVHCGGWCINADSPGSLSDSTFSPFNLMNCQKGGLHVAYGSGNHVTGARIQDMYGLNGIVMNVNGSINVIEGNTFDQNYDDMMLGGDSSGGSYIVSGNFSCRLQGGAHIHLTGFIGAITGGHNLGCDPTYRVDSGTTFARVGFYDFFPTYFDSYTQSVLQGSMR